MTAPLEMRLYGMMQRLLVAVAHAEDLEQVSPRGVVGTQDALDAVIQIAAAIDELAQGGQMSAERAAWVVALLMVIRDYIEPLPQGLGLDGEDHLTPDLDQMVQSLRTARRNAGNGSAGH
ncbi:hypothetical protein [Amycolatopsis sacchari]|uniref:hypothetical protein n=1 Tax=Amycolatopsis sacchari TaxID=115433 RepID=UPI000B813E53|nr:hypothetical protein [Amycolatopsis sacchari]